MIKIVKAQCLKYERTEYAKQIRKKYELGLVNESMSRLRMLSIRNDGISNTITTVLKDYYICIK